jgi:outer membrane protein OmpA-like peptidoglycan-associated protein
MNRLLASLLLLVGLSQFACTGGERDQPQQTDAAAPNPDASPVPDEAGRPSADSGSGEPTPTSDQNYTFSGGTDALQIVGSETNYDILLPTDVLFDFDKAELRSDGMPLLEKAKAHLNSHKTSQIHVWGHTDSKGSDQYNFTLSQRRAIAIATWLKKNVKTDGLIMSVGRGEQEPLAPNENPDGSDNPVNRQKNRRVTLSVAAYPDVNKLLDDARQGRP